MQRDGTEINVTGTVFDSKGNEVTEFKTDVRGMGQFMMRYKIGEEYYALCTNSEGEKKQFELPVAGIAGYALSAICGRDNLLSVSVMQPETRVEDDTLLLLIHSRGILLDVLIWNNLNTPLVFTKDFFPSGVCHLLLLNKDLTPLSERLIFVDNNDQAKVEGRSDKASYPARAAVEYTVHITGVTGEPVMGNFSVSVTDDHSVIADTTINILTSLLLSSDLRGNIPDPEYFFRLKGQ